jgi:winged helix-turn-helix DNA-binding protein
MWLPSPFRAPMQGAHVSASNSSDLATSPSRITVALASIAAAGLVISSAMFAAFYAWSVGQSKGQLFAAVMVAFAVSLELCKPMALAYALQSFRRLAVVRGALLGLLAAVAVTFSLVSELSLVGGSRSDVVAERQATVDAREDRREALKAARAELAGLARSRTKPEIEADIARVLAGVPQAGDCTRPTASYRTLCSRVAVLRGEIGRAERRATLQATVSKGIEAPATAPAVGESDPGAASLASVLSMLGWSIQPGKLSDLLILLSVLSIEAGSALAGVLVQAVSGAPAGHQPPSQTGSQTVLPVSEPGVRTSSQRQTPSPDTRKPEKPNGDGPKPRGKNKRKPSGKRAKDRTRKLGNVVRLVQRQGGHLSASNRELAKRLGLSKSRTHEIVREAVAAGLLTAESSRAGTRLAVAG